MPFSLLSLIPASIMRYLVAALVGAAIMAGIAFYIWNSATATERLKCDSRISAIQNVQTIQQLTNQNETIQTLQKAKIISRNNSVLERDQLIDKL